MSSPRLAARPRLVLGMPAPFDGGAPFALTGRAVAAHKHVLGLTGQGKSKLLVSMAVQLINQGIGVAVIDPHADLTQDILGVLLATGFFEDERAYERLLYVDFARGDRFLPFNVLCQPYPDHTVARNLVEAFKRAWSALEGGAAPQLENILLAATLVLIQNGQPLTELARLLSDKTYRDGLLTRVDDRQVRHFFQERFDRLGKTSAMIESTLRRVFLLTFTPALRHTLGQRQNLLNLRQQLDRGTSVLYNLGGLDAESQRLLGCLLTVGYEMAALSRADLPEHRRRPYQLILDEFSMFSAQSEESLARVLDLTRKYGLSLTLSHQTWSQIAGRLRGALQNAVEIIFQPGYEDARWAGPRMLEYDPQRLKDDPLGLRQQPAYAGVGEQAQMMTSALERLGPRQAYVRVGRRTTKLRTLAVSPAAEQTALVALIERYAERLLRPAGAEVEGDQGGGGATPVADRRRPRAVRRRVELDQE